MLADGDTSSAGSVVVGEVSIGVQAVGQFVGQFGQLVGTVLAAQPGELGLGHLPGLDVDEVGQPVDETADHRHMGGTDAPIPLRCGGGRQQRRQGFAGDRLPIAQIGGLMNTPRGVRAGDAQPVGQRGGQFSAQLRRIGVLAELVDQRVLDGRQPPAEGLAARQHGQPLRRGQRVERQLQGTVEVGLKRVESPDDLFPTTRTHVRMLLNRPDKNRNLATTETKVAKEISVI